MPEKERPSRTTWSIINPFELEKNELVEFMRNFKKTVYFSDGEVPIVYKGSEPLIKLIEAKKIGIGATIRISPGGSTHLFYMVTSRGFVNVLYPNQPIKNFSEVLDDKGMSGRLENWFFEEHELVGNEKDFFSVDDEGLEPPTSSV